MRLRSHRIRGKNYPIKNLHFSDVTGLIVGRKLKQKFMMTTFRSVMILTNMLSVHL